MQTENDLAPLLAPRTAAEAVDNINTLQALYEAQGRVLSAGQSERRELLLHGTDDDLAAHDSAMRAAEVYRERCTAAAQALKERAAELQVSEKQAAARAQLKAATKARARGVAIHGEFGDRARELRDLVDELREINREVEGARRAAVAAGLPCDLSLPVDEFCVAERYEESVSQQREVGVYDARGRIVGSADDRGPAIRTVRHSRFIPGQRAPDLTRCEIVLPDPLDARLSIIHQR